jgi:hypothetical protein
MLGLSEKTSMETSVAGVIVSAVDPDMIPNAAVIVVVPAVTEVSIPCEPAALLMAATPTTDELQATEFVRFCIVLSE